MLKILVFGIKQCLKYNACETSENDYFETNDFENIDFGQNDFANNIFLPILYHEQLHFELDIILEHRCSKKILETTSPCFTK